eukprot:NODE_22_length_38364_cov_0.248661.p1 type:complete len:1377 gc:universal NODE_22_length_38364_cov_0.248661:12236-8106(-)
MINGPSKNCLLLYQNKLIFSAMFQSSLLKLNTHLNKKFEYPSQKQEILQSIKDNLSQNPQLFLDVLVKYAQVDKISQAYIEDILNAELLLKPNEMILMGQFIHLNIKSHLQHFSPNDIDALLFLMRKLYALYKQSNSSQMGALFLQLTQPSDNNQELVPYYNAILLVLCKLSCKYPDDLCLFSILFLSKQQFINYNILLPMTINLTRSPINSILSTYILQHTISLLPVYPHHFEVYFKLLLNQINEHSIHVLSTINVKYWIEFYINYDCNPTMQINLFEKLILFFNKTITNHSDYEPYPALVEPFYPASTVVPFTPNQLRTYCLNHLSILLEQWVNWSNTPLPIEQQAIDHAIHQKQFKSILEQGLKKFNVKPKHGIQFLVSNNCIPDNTPASIAKVLFHNGHQLSLTALGDYLGELENTEIMRQFIDFYDFTGLSFLSALRLLLSKFRLPGEAQKIDRLMLKFADRFTTFNQLFANADTAYILAYSIILLNTDLHNPQVKKKMSLEDFIKNNRGIDDGHDINPTILTEMYYDILDNEIKLDDKVKPIQVQGFVPGQKQQESLVINETSAIEKEFKRLDVKYATSTSPSGANNANTTPNGNSASATTPVHSPSKSITSTPSSATSLVLPANSIYITASHPDHVRDMFLLVWTSLLHTYSHALQYSNNTSVLNDALLGIQHSIHIACKYQLLVELNAFVTTLSKYCSKNPLIIEAFIAIAIREGDYLQGNWYIILTTIISTHNNSNGIGNVNNATNSISVAIDKLWQSTSQLNAINIVEFITQMCVISKDELKHDLLYACSKLVEISIYNMNRIKVEWTQLWGILGNYFVEMTMLDNIQHCQFAIDSLRQLAFKFLDLVEVEGFKFQATFMKPFLLILQQCKHAELKSFIVECMDLFVQGKYSNLKSGWGMILLILQQDMPIECIVLGFETVKRIMGYLELVISNGAYSDYLTTIACYCKHTELPKISLQAIELIRQITRQKTVQQSNASIPAEESDDQGILEKSSIVVSLCTIIISCDLEVRQRGVSILYDYLNNTSGLKSLIRLLQPLFDELSNDNDENRVIWLSTTFTTILRSHVELYSKYYNELEEELDMMLTLLKQCILHENEVIARLGTSCLMSLISNNYKNIKWELIGALMVDLFKNTTAHELFTHFTHLQSATPNASPDASAPAAVSNAATVTSPTSSSADLTLFQQVISQCVLQLLLIHLVDDMMKLEDITNIMDKECIIQMCDCLQSSWEFAHEFNENEELRFNLWKAGFMKQRPNLHKQETTSIMSLIRLLLKLIVKHRDMEERLIGVIMRLMQTYMVDGEEKKSKNAVKGAIEMVMDYLMDMENDIFDRIGKNMYPSMVMMTRMENDELMRFKMCDVLNRYRIYF